MSDAFGRRPKSAPHSWRGIAIGMGLVVLGVAVSLILMVRYLDERPLDLFNHSAQLVIVLEDTLAANEIPPANIRRSEPMERQDESASWYAFEIDVATPAGTSLDRVIATIRDVMALNDVTVTEESATEEGRQRTLSLASHGREFAFVRLMALAPRLNPEQRRLELAAHVKERLNALGVATGSARTEEADSAKEGAESSGTVVLDAIVPRSTTPEDVLSAVGEGLTDPEAELSLSVKPDAQEQAIQTLTLKYSGRECIRVLLKRPPEPGSERPRPPAVQLPEVSRGAKTYQLAEMLDIALPKPEELPLESNGLEHKEMGPPPAEGEPEKRPGAPKVAIIVDDGGYGGAVTETILGLDSSLTLAILPHAPHSRETAKRAGKKGFEVLLHMPMENSADKKTFPGHIATKMKPKQIRELTEKALKDVPNAVGTNNHEGSKFTAHPEAMRNFLEVAKAKSLFFVDSRTIAESVAYDVAKELGVPAGQRDVFLDHDGDPDVIRKQFKALIEHAKERGSAIGICHFRPRTAKVLVEVLPTLKSEQIELVHVSELVE